METFIVSFVLIGPIWMAVLFGSVPTWHLTPKERVHEVPSGAVTGWICYDTWRRTIRRVDFLAYVDGMRGEVWVILDKVVCSS